MLTKRIIPCLDVKNGQVVKGVKFKNHQVVGDILELAKRYSDQGADELVFYDITASSERRSVGYEWIRKIAKEINIPFCVAGGINSLDVIREILQNGADKISINTPALENPQLISEAAKEFGSQCIVVGVDSKNEDGEDLTFMYTGDTSKTVKSNKSTVDWIKEVQDRGAGEIVLNSMDTDGVKKGYNIDLLSKVDRICKVPLIASGGAGKKEDFLEVFEKTGVNGALAASVFHYGEIELSALKKYLAGQNLPIRI
jgi:imidazole glycerol-phosphate synthase subunit HisF